jgi:hypothetical protein
MVFRVDYRIYKSCKETCKLQVYEDTLRPHKKNIYIHQNKKYSRLLRRSKVKRHFEAEDQTVIVTCYRNNVHSLCRVLYYIFFLVMKSFLGKQLKNTLRPSLAWEVV